MDINTIARFLDNHSTQNTLVQGRIFATEVTVWEDEHGRVCTTETQIDVTDYSATQLREWMGY
jgi:hypothetical protein